MPEVQEESIVVVGREKDVRAVQVAPFSSPFDLYAVGY